MSIFRKEAPNPSVDSRSGRRLVGFLTAAALTVGATQADIGSDFDKIGFGVGVAEAAAIPVPPGIPPILPPSEGFDCVELGANPESIENGDMCAMATVVRGADGAAEKALVQFIEQGTDDTTNTPTAVCKVGFGTVQGVSETTATCASNGILSPHRVDGEWDGPRRPGEFAELDQPASEVTDMGPDYGTGQFIDSMVVTDPELFDAEAERLFFVAPNLRKIDPSRERRDYWVSFPFGPDDEPDNQMGFMIALEKGSPCDPITGLQHVNPENTYFTAAATGPFRADDRPHKSDVVDMYGVEVGLALAVPCIGGGETPVPEVVERIVEVPVPVPEPRDVR